MNDASSPRMPTIQDFTFLNPVGVPASRCIIDADRIRALTARRPIKPTLPNCHSARQLNPAEGSTYRRGKSVQTTDTTSQEVTRNFGLVMSAEMDKADGEFFWMYMH